MLPVDILISQVEMTELKGKPPAAAKLYATHVGVLRIGGYMLTVYQLNDGQRVIDADDVVRFFGVEVSDATDLRPLDSEGE